MKLTHLFVVVIALCLLGCCLADVYMHNPRGSNDRLNENGDRQNDKRLFNSQNNARGGYCWGPPLNYYAGSELSIEWTSQHACGAGTGVMCNIVIQYMCGYTDGPLEIRMRDGTTTTTITDNPETFNTLTEDETDFVYGMHESHAYYQTCKGRSRNTGLYTAEQNVGTNTPATRTRQNAGGAQYGFECPEERDYYPYWGPSPWKDIAILTHDSKTLCPYFQKESQNVKGREYCAGNPAITQQGCSAAGGSWTSHPAWDIDQPDCQEAPYSRDNHLGNGMNGFTNSFNWTLPTSETEKCIIGSKCSCALRIRYNVTTGEIAGYGDSYTDSASNKKLSLGPDPYVIVSGQNLSLAVDTAQYGRTFQDRSHLFHILERPGDVAKEAIIHNLNVRGKRGNIVQTYPATEYDFVPKQLEIKIGDYIHFQWTGCDTNPDNEGEGTRRTDRSNLVQMVDNTYNRPINDADWEGDAKNIKPLFEDDAQRAYFAHLGQVGCKSLEELREENNNNQNTVNEDVENCMKLNAATSPYFNGGLVQMKTEGTFYFMSTRNNNFSNRTQKGVIIVNPLLPAYAIALIVIGGTIVAAGVAAGGLVLYAKKFPLSKVAVGVDAVRMKASGLYSKLRRN